MRCPKCGAFTKVIRSMEMEELDIYRRRECMECGYRFNTEERKKHVEKTVPGKPAVQQRTDGQKAKPYGLSDLYIALRLR